MTHALAFLFGLALGVAVGLHLVYTQPPRRPLPGHSWAPPRYGLVDAEYDGEALGI